jgi:hypothetical protein
MALAAIGNMTLVPDEIHRYGEEGEKCRAILDWCRENRIADEEVVYVDSVPPVLTNGFSEMVHLFLEGHVTLKNLHLLRVPPFLIAGSPEFDSMSPETILLRFKPAAFPKKPYPSYEKISKAELSRGNLFLPVFSFRYRFDVVPPEKMLARIQSGQVDLETEVLLDRAPTLPIGPYQGPPARFLQIRGVSQRKVFLEVHCPRPALLLICLPVKLKSRKGKILLDGQAVDPFQAFSVFNALELSKGSHQIDISYF